MISILTSLLFRLSCLIVVWHVLKRFFESEFLAHVALSLFQLSLIAPQSKVLSQLFSLFTEDNRIIDWITRSNLVYFVYFDYMSLAVVIVIALNSTKVVALSHSRLIILGIILFLTFDYLPVFIAILILLSKTSRALTKAIAVLVPGVLLITLSIIITDKNSSLSTNFSFYAENNLKQALAIPVLALLTLIPPILLGLVFQRYFFRTHKPLGHQDLAKLRYNCRIAILSLSFVHLISIITSNFLGEFARQSLGLQLLLFLYVGSRSKPRSAHNHST